MNGMTLVEKILAGHAGLSIVRPGQYVEAQVDLVILSDVAFRSIQAFKELGAKRVFDPNRIAIIFDHNVPARDTRSATVLNMMKEFAFSQGIKNLFDQSRGGIQHLVPAEKGLIKPGMIVVDGSHACTDGALATLATGVSAEDRAVAMATGRLWFRVPETLRVVLRGRSKEHISGMDIGLALLGRIGAAGATYKAIEFTGDSLGHLSMSARFTLCNLTMEAGAKTGIIGVDEKTIGFYEDMGLAVPKTYPAGDPDAAVAETLEIDVADLEFQVAAPDSPDNVTDLKDLQGIPITHAFIGFCVNGRLSDLAKAAEILENKEVSTAVSLIVTPGSQRVFKEAVRLGFVQTLLNAGAVITPSTCGACAGIHMGVLGPGDVAISTSNRNFKGRMGHPDSKVYLASPAVAAASAIAGEIVSPHEVIS
jgi:3-isopropylmalate/(R)-2-methylmalate dehydratase large subunit